jgi:hypothetical protein
MKERQITDSSVKKLTLLVTRRVRKVIKSKNEGRDILRHRVHPGQHLFIIIGKLVFLYMVGNFFPNNFDLV